MLGVYSLIPQSSQSLDCFKCLGRPTVLISWQHNIYIQQVYVRIYAYKLIHSHQAQCKYSFFVWFLFWATSFQDSRLLYPDTLLSTSGSKVLSVGRERGNGGKLCQIVNLLTILLMKSPHISLARKYRLSPNEVRGLRNAVKLTISSS